MWPTYLQARHPAKHSGRLNAWNSVTRIHTSASGKRFHLVCVCVYVRNLAPGSFSFVCLLHFLRVCVCVGGVCGAQLQREVTAERGLTGGGAAAQHGHVEHRQAGESSGEVHCFTGQQTHTQQRNYTLHGYTLFVVMATWSCAGISNRGMISSHTVFHLWTDKG